MADASGADSSADGVGEDRRFELTFNIETLRMIAYLALVFMVFVGIVVTEFFAPHEDDHNVVFQIFGFNHICNVFDHQPSRTISALLVLSFIIPMSAFVMCSFYRTYDAAKEGRVPQRLQTYNKLITPYVLLSVCYTYMWFVNPPDGDYGFIAHYLPYVALQLAFGLLAIQEVGFLISTGSLPFGASISLAKTYLVVLLVTTVICQIAVFSMLLGVPLLDSAGNPTDRLAFQVLMYGYSFLAILMPIFLAARNRKNGQLNTIRFS